MGQNWTELESHPACAVFPLLGPAEIGRLAEDIAANGLLHPVVLHEGKILDGRNRLLACEKAGVEPRFTEWGGSGSPTAWVVSVNLHRRHLDESQRAMVAAKLKSLNLDSGDAAQCAADLVNVSRASVFHGQKVLRSGAEELIAAVESGKIPVSAAAKIADEEPDVQRAVTERIASGEAKNVFQAVRQEEEKKRAAALVPERADARIICGDVREVLNDWHVGANPHCVVMDPPYGIETHNTRRGGKDYADGERYALEALAFVCERLEELCDPSAHLYVFSGYTHAHSVKRLLGEHFTVQDNPIIWVKSNHTMCDFSSWYPSKHEYIWFCKIKGSTRKLAKCTPDVLEVGHDRESTHSAEKPTELLRALIENSTLPGELVLDPFVGSGSTGVAAAQLKRRFIGIDQEEKWVGVARARVAGA